MVILIKPNGKIWNASTGGQVQNEGCDKWTVRYYRDHLALLCTESTVLEF